MNIGPKSESTPFIQEEMKVKQEEDEKNQLLPFDIIKNAFSNLFPTQNISNEELRNKIKSIDTDSADFYDFSLKLTEIERKSLTSLQNVYLGIDYTINKNPKKIEKMIDDLLELGDYDKAIEITNGYLSDLNSTSEEGYQTFSNNQIKEKIANSFEKIINNLLANGDLEKAIEVAKSMNDEHVKTSSFQQIHHAYKRRDNLEKAFEIIQYIPSESTQNLLYNRFLDDNDVKDIRDPDRIIEFIEKTSLSDSEKKQHLMKIFIQKFVAEGNIDKAIEITDKISGANIRGNIFLDIYFQLKKTGNHVLAAEIDERAMINFRQAVENIDEKIKLANEKVDPKIKDQFLFDIARTLLKIVNPQNIKKANEILTTITHPGLKNSLMRQINSVTQNSLKGG